MENSNEIDLVSLQKKLSWFDKLLDETYVKLHAEREQGPRNVEEIERALKIQTKGLHDLESKIQKAKDHITKRRQEMMMWQTSIEKMGHHEKEGKLGHLHHETTWRLQDIINKETDVAALSHALMKKQEHIEWLKVSLQAFKEGFHNKSIAEDPRLVHICAEKKAIKEKLAKLQS